VRLPTDVVHVRFGIGVGDSAFATFGFWLLWPGSSGAPESAVTELVLSWVTTPMVTFLDCMNSAARFDTCRCDLGTPTGDYRSYHALAPNAGAQPAGELIDAAVGLYVQTLEGGRGSGSRLHLPGVPTNFTDDFRNLSDYGWQQLVFAADALASWPPTLLGPSLAPAVLGTLQQRRAGLPLDPPTFSPATLVRPTRVLEYLPRRAYANRRLSQRL
jgi:hypothetical protein